MTAQALLACMVSLDLNRIRTGITDTLEDSDYTSIQQRIVDYAGNSTTKTEENSDSLELSSFIGSNANDSGIPYHLKDYFELANWTGRAILEDKTGFITGNTPEISSKLGIDNCTWIHTVVNFGNRFYSHVGPVDKMQQVCDRVGKKWMHGIRACKQFWNIQPDLIGDW